MGLMSFISGILKPATQLVDEIHTSEEEKLTLKAKLMDIENQLQLKVLEYETHPVTSEIGQCSRG